METTTKIISSYWSDKKQEVISENAFLGHVKEFELKTVFIGFKQIRNFKIGVENDKMILRYALAKNGALKYYANFLNHSIALRNETVIFLQDKNWVDYKNQILNEETLNILRR